MVGKKGSSRAAAGKCNETAAEKAERGDTWTARGVCARVEAECTDGACTEGAAEGGCDEAAAEKAEAIAVFSDAELSLVGAGIRPKIASVNERADMLREKGIDDSIIAAALSECGLKEEEYKKDAWGRVIAPNFFP